MGNQQASIKRGTRVEQQQKKQVIAQQQQVIVAKRQEQINAIVVNSLTSNALVVSSNQSAVGFTDPIALVRASDAANKIIERGDADFIKDDLLAMILVLNAAKWKEITSSKTVYTVAQLRFVIREMTTDPERIKKSILESVESPVIVKAITD